MGSTARRAGAICLLLIAPPLAGVLLTGEPLGPYLEFPPETAPADPAPFSWAGFAVVSVIVLAAVVPLGLAWRRAARRHRAPPAAPRRPFPAWGWLGVALVVVFWILAWTRFAWFEPLQRHTFTPLWIGYILVASGLTQRLGGSCLLAREPALFAALFPLSAVFWWFFEYLNRFVANWYYVGVAHFSPLEYVAFASVSFSTVLPAVLATTELLGTLPRLAHPLARMPRLRLARPRAVAALGLPAVTLALAGLAVAPDALFPLVWVAPGLTLLCVAVLTGYPTPLAPVAAGDWRPLVLPALAALVCGVFWELWNSASLARWEYAVPYVERFHLFAMPLLGYAGYLPFGLECLLAAGLLRADPIRWAPPPAPPARPPASAA